MEITPECVLVHLSASFQHEVMCKPLLKSFKSLSDPQDLQQEDSCEWAWPPGTRGHEEVSHILPYFWQANTIFEELVFEWCDFFFLRGQKGLLTKNISTNLEGQKFLFLEEWRTYASYPV